MAESSKNRHQHTNDETMRLALEVAQLGFWNHDIAGNSIVRSPEWGRMIGYEPEEVEGKMSFWLDHVHPDDRPAVDQSIREHESGQRRKFRIEHRLRTKDGQWKWILNWGRVTERDEAGRPLRALGFHLDITERKQAEAVLARADKLSTIGTLAGGIAHDFNNLLTAIRGNLQLAEAATDGVSRRQYLANADRATRRSQELTGRLLTYARGGAPVLDPLDLEQVIIEAGDLVMSGSPSRMHIECEPGLPEVAGSESHLIQVFQNLLLNARQAMPEGGVVTVTCATFLLENLIPDLMEVGEYVEVIVSDQGPGIADDEIDQIFDPFFTTRPEGTGLGLATAHSIVVDHHGLLEAVPSPSEGACMRVLLPVAGHGVVERENRGPASSESRPGRILIVDDDEMVRDLAATVVGNLGFTVVETDDGGKAAEIYELARSAQEPFQAVLMDLTIPGGVGGAEAVARILEKDPDARVIVTSGYSADPVMAKYDEYGFSARLSKPYEIADMRRVLLDVLARE
jgi:PAS domain S-box-containing protein